ncbi:MAG: hypothetical protein MJ208_02635 [Bacilli bacterium]|nr:hypothetical protein [Bacilli bacterium]
MKLSSFRLKQDIEIKTMAKMLQMSSFRLWLIEHNLINIPAQKYNDFIKCYHLPTNYFNQPHNILSHKATKSVAAVVCLLSLIMTSCGVYFLKKNDINPREGWSDNLKTTADVFKTMPTFSGREVEDYRVASAVKIDEHNRCYHTLSATRDEDRQRADIAIYEYDSDVKYSNMFSSFQLNDWLRTDITASCIDNEIGGNFNIELVPIKKLTVSFIGPYKIINGKLSVAQVKTKLNYKINKNVEFTIENLFYPGSIYYDIAYDLTNASYLKCMNIMNELLLISTYDLRLGIPYLNANDLLLDLKQSSNLQSNNLKTGLSLLLVSLPFILLTLVVILLSLIYRYKPNKTQEVVAIDTNLKNKKSSPIQAQTKNECIKVAPSLLNSTLLKSFILIVTIAAGILTNIAAKFYLQANPFGNDIGTFDIISKNLFAISLMFLVFFGCVYVNKKGKHSIMPLITISLALGIFYYVFDISSYHYFTSSTGSYSSASLSIASNMPDNIFLPLFFSLLMYWCLFIASKKNAKTSIISGLISLIPASILVASFVITQLTINIDNNYYINSLFSPNLATANLFIVSYLYVSYFVSRLMFKKHSNVAYDEYLKTKQHMTSNKIIAISIVALLFAANLTCYFIIRDNAYNFGYHYGVILLVPIILLYRYRPTQKEIKINSLVLCITAIILISSLSIFIQSACVPEEWIYAK